MSNISPNSLFHFTPKLDFLINIFKTGFKPRYFYEELLLNESKAIRGHSLGIPMVCFCDISLGQINNHIKSYGNYGIGMRKEWAIKNHLNPIVYLNKDAVVADVMSIMIENLINLAHSGNHQIQEKAGLLINNFYNLQMHSKPYAGSFTHRGKLHNNKKFYDEREWRYIPLSMLENAFVTTLSKESMLDKEKLSKANIELERYSLSFTPEDVKYIFVKEERQIHKIVTEIRKLKNQDPKAIDILTSKILTTRNLREDF